MNRRTQFVSRLAPIFGIVIAMGATSPVQAAGTLAGTEITNAGQINYKFAGVAQNPLSPTDTITVDRLIRFKMENLSGSIQDVTPPINAISRIRITNQSNVPLSFSPQVYKYVDFGGDTTFNDTYIDKNGNGIIDPGTDLHFPLASRQFPGIAPDEHIDMLLSTNIPAATALDVNFTFFVKYWVRAFQPSNIPGVDGVDLGFFYSNFATKPNTSGMDTVLSDPAQPDAEPGYGEPNDGGQALVTTFRIAIADLSVARFNMPISDPVNGTAEPKVIPGATVEYCVAITNGQGAETAADVTLVETLGANLTADENFGVYENGTMTNGVCDTDGTGGGTPGGSIAGDKITATIDSLAGGETKTIRYRAKVM